MVKWPGGDNLRLSHDFEDIIYVLNNCQDITTLFERENNNTLADYISSWVSEMLNRHDCCEEIECMLPYGDYGRVDYTIEILTHLKR